MRLPHDRARPFGPTPAHSGGPEALGRGRRFCRGIASSGWTILLVGLSHRWPVLGEAPRRLHRWWVALILSPTSATLMPSARRTDRARLRVFAGIRRTQPARRRALNQSCVSCVRTIERAAVIDPA